MTPDGTGGFHGRVLRVDLERGASELSLLPAHVLRHTLGGVGLGTWLLLRECPAGIDPLAPEAPLIFAFSPLVGTPLTTSAKFAVVAKSPLTGRVCDAMSGSRFALEGKGLGVDAIVVRGAAAEPSILSLTRTRESDVRVEIHPAPSWGEPIGAAVGRLLGRGAVAAIGPAGENLVRYASISSEGRHAGRGGLGAVMGAKRLKAIVVAGAQPTPVADPARLEELSRDLSRRSLGPETARYRELGTAAQLATLNRLAALPTRNFRDAQFDGAASLSGEQLDALRGSARGSCVRCTIGCGHMFGRRGATGEGAPAEVRLEYESLASLGPLVGVADPAAILRAVERCDELGLDTISTGGTIAFLMECAERGLVTGVPEFGDGDGLVSLIEDIAHRRGRWGPHLAEGSRRLALRIGGGSLAFAPQVKGLEIPAYDPRSMQAMALGYAVATRGADHNRSGAYEADLSARVDRFHGDERSVRLAIASEDRAALLDSLILCKFLRGVFRDVWREATEILQAVTGLDFDDEELRSLSRRVVAQRKAFNIREGWQPEEDTLPDRFFETEAVENAPRPALPRKRLSWMVRTYNLARGWTADGWLRPEQLAELGVDTDRARAAARRPGSAGDDAADERGDRREGSP